MSTLSTALRRAIDGRWAHIREEARSELEPARFAPPSRELTREEYRARVADQLRELASTGHPARGLSKDMGGQGDFGASVTAFEMLGHADLSLLVKAGVHWGLFGGAVANLGTQRHHTAYLPQILSAELPGCFAMTETGHGSDVQSLGTTATYDPDTDELVVHTPSPAARKDYIGGAARDGRLAAVFAQLVTGGESHGVHCVLVPIRDEAGEPMPGVTIGDCGAKAGLAGVDNGRLTFDHVRVPRTSLLNRYGDIDEHGVYTSPDRQPDATLLHHARHARARADQRRRRGGCRDPHRAHAGDHVCRAPPPVRPSRQRGRGRCSSTTGPTSASCCPRSRRPTRCCSPRTSSCRACTTCSSAATPRTRTTSASSRPGPRASRPWRPPTRRRRSRRAARPAGAPATWR